VTQSLESALERKARIYCEVVGEGFSTDAYHLVKPEPHGDGASRAMRQAIDRAVRGGLVDVSADKSIAINAHATSTPIGDICEWNAIAAVVEAHQWISRCLVTANKANIGHCFGAAGAIETIFAIMSLREVASAQQSTLPQILNCEDPEPTKTEKVRLVRGSPMQTDHSLVLKNSFGFGGVNVSLLLQKYRPN